MDQHLRYLDECAELHENMGKNVGRAGAPSDPLERLSLLNPDMMLEIAKVVYGFFRRAVQPSMVGWADDIPASTDVMFALV